MKCTVLVASSRQCLLIVFLNEKDENYPLAQLIGSDYKADSWGAGGSSPVVVQSFLLAAICRQSLQWTLVPGHATLTSVRCLDLRWAEF
jgi:hypothetical protein